MSYERNNCNGENPSTQKYRRFIYSLQNILIVLPLAGFFYHLMRPFDSINMGFRCKTWSTQNVHDVNVVGTPELQGPGTQGQQWIVNAATGGRLEDIMRESTVVLDGGPRWVLSTALGFVTGGLWWTVIWVALFGRGFYTAYTSSKSAPWDSGAEGGGLIVYTILAATLSIASVPGQWKGLNWGLVVEMVLCVSVIVSVAIIHNFLVSFLEENTGFAWLADLGGGVTPAAVWSVAFNIRGKATKVVETKLRGLWCCHPIAGQTALSIQSLWDDWADRVDECADRVGGYSMLGFQAYDLAKLSDISRGKKATKVIHTLGISIGLDTELKGYWIKQSLAFKVGYDCRIKNKNALSDKNCLSFIDTQRVVIGIPSQPNPKIDAYHKQLHSNRYLQDQFRASDGFGEYDSLLFYAGALIADSDDRERKVELGQYGPRLAIAIALLVEGTDPLARLDCYYATWSVDSREHSLNRAISFSTKALVTELAASANVEMVDDPLSERGLAYATGPTRSKHLSYSPDEMAAASHMDEAIVVSDDTFTAGTPMRIFETLWGGSDSVEKKVDVSDSVPLTASTPGAGDSAWRGWLCKVGFMLAILVAHVSDNAPSALVTVSLVIIPAGKLQVMAHMKNHFYMIYISFILNYIRFFSRAVLLSPRGPASAAKANRAFFAVLGVVSVLPAIACVKFSGWKWWVAFTPCMLSNLPGLLNTVNDGWDSAFQYEWWSWHIPNRWYAGRSYLRMKGLRKRVGKNVLSVNLADNSDRKVASKVLPFGGTGVRFMVIGG